MTIADLDAMAGVAITAFLIGTAVGILSSLIRRAVTK